MSSIFGPSYPEGTDALYIGGSQTQIGGTGSTYSFNGIVNSNFVVNGNSKLNGTLIVNGAQNNTGDLNIIGTQNNTGNLNLIGTQNNTGNLNLIGTQNNTGNLNIIGSQTISSNLNIGTTGSSSAVTINGIIFNPPLAGSAIYNYIDIGLFGDGVTDDSVILSNFVNNLQNIYPNKSFTILLNSPLGHALYNTLTFGSNITLQVDAPLYYYSDLSVRFQGSYYYGPIKPKLNPNYNVSSGDTVIYVDNLSVFTVGCVVNFEGMSQNGSTLWNDPNRVVAINNTGYITLFKGLEYSYQYQYQNGSYTTIKIVAGNKSSTNISSGSYTCIMDNSDVSMYSIGQTVVFNDFQLIGGYYTNSTSNNTFNNDMNVITQINVSTSTLTFAKSIVHTYTSNAPVFVIPIKTCENSKMIIKQQEYMKYPIKKSTNCLQLTYCNNCHFIDSTIKNKRRKDTILVSPAIGLVLSINEITSGFNFSINLIPGIYQLDDFCTMVKSLLIASPTSSYSYKVTYNFNTGCVTISSGDIYKYFNINMTTTTAYSYFGMLPSITYSSATTYTGQPIYYSGSFNLRSFDLNISGQGLLYQFVYNEGTSDITLTLPNYYYTLSTLLLQLQMLMTSNSQTGWVYTCSIGTDETITIASNSYNFSIVLNSSNSLTTIWKHLCLHNSSGSILSTLSGASSYNSGTWSTTRVYPICSNRGNAFRFDNSYNCSAVNMTVGGTSHNTSGEGYGGTITRSAMCIINGFKCSAQRHSILVQAGANTNIITNVVDSGFYISCIDGHGQNSTYNTCSNVVAVAGNLYSPDSTQKGFLRVGNTTHNGGDSNWTFSNCTVYYGTNQNPTTNINMGIVLSTVCSDNVFDNITMYGGDTFIQMVDVSGRVNPLQYISNGNVFKNSYCRDLKQNIINLNPNNSGTGSIMSDTLIDNCTFNNCGSGSTLINSYASIKNCTNITIKNCYFENQLTGSPDDYVLQIGATTSAIVTKNLFKNITRGVYFLINCGIYTLTDNTFNTLTGASHKYWRDGGNATPNANTPTVYNNNFINTSNVLEQLDLTSGTITRINGPRLDTTSLTSSLITGSTGTITSLNSSTVANSGLITTGSLTVNGVAITTNGGGGVTPSITYIQGSWDGGIAYYADANRIYFIKSGNIVTMIIQSFTNPYISSADSGFNIQIPTGYRPSSNYTPSNAGYILQTCIGATNNSIESIGRLVIDSAYRIHINIMGSGWTSGSCGVTPSTSITYVSD